MDDRLLFFRALCFAVVVPILLRFKIERLPAIINGNNEVHPVAGLRVERVSKIIEDALDFGYPVVRKGCLTRGVTLYHFLRREGLDLTLCFGFGTVDGEYIGHCWLMRNGVPFLERHDPLKDFLTMFEISPRRRTIQS